MQSFDVHSPGSVAYLVNSTQKSVLFGQDIHGPIHSSLLSNAADYKRSLKKLITLKADILCEGHFGIFQGKEQVESFIRSYLTN